MIDWIHQALRPHFHLGWNLFLASIPLCLSLYLFRLKPRHAWLWWPLLGVFIAFLPNAAYTTTDVIHFVTEVRDQPELPIWTVVYIIIPKYAAFMFLGFQAHVISLIRAGDYLRWRGRRSWVVPCELALNFLCAVGIYWGRYLRFNSWEIVSDPDKIADQALHSLLMDQFGWKVIAWYFCAITAGYYVVKAVDVSVWASWQHAALRRRMPLPVMAAFPQDTSYTHPDQ